MTEIAGAKWFQHTVYSIIAVILLSTLVTSHIFIYSSLTPVLTYCLGVSVLIVFTGSLIIVRKKNDYNINFQILTITLWLSYVFIHGLISNNLNLFHYYIIINIVFFLVLTVLFRAFSDIYKLLFITLNILAFGEAVLCIGQYLKLFDSLNNYFSVTGSCENPNVTAMFLVMALPACWFNTYLTKGTWNKVIKASILVIICAVFMLQCRTAIIGLIAEALIIGNYQFRLLDQFRSKTNRSLAILLSVLFGGIIMLLGISLYNSKRASADGRKLIYKISTQMILNKPITGYGYGTFERNYNLAQADYFKNGNGTSTEAENADFVKMGYNEFLQNGVEGGLIGMLILALTFYSFLRVSFDQGRDDVLNAKTTANTIAITHIGFKASYAAVVAFIIMSVFNFSIQAIPAMCLFMLYSALLVIYTKSKSYSIIREYAQNKVFYFSRRFIAGSFFCLAGILFGWYFSIAIRGNYLNKMAQTDAKKGHCSAALNIMNTLGTGLNSYESYWTNYANITLDIKDYDHAIVRYAKAINLTSNPSVYMKIAQCYEEHGDYSNAEQNLLTAKYIQPNRMQPRFILMNLYLKMKDTSKATLEAKWIVAIQPKIPSKETDFYKYNANMVMNKLGHPYAKAFNSPFNFKKASYLTLKKHE
jgi:O-antigen ligase